MNFALDMDRIKEYMGVLRTRNNAKKVEKTAEAIEDIAMVRGIGNSCMMRKDWWKG